MTKDTTLYDEWNASRQPMFTHLPMRKMLKLIEGGQEQEAMYEYCRSTNGGLVEAKTIVDALKRKEPFLSPYGYTGWKTGGVPLFWCRGCDKVRKHSEVNWQGIEGDWDHEPVYSFICQVCKLYSTNEFHYGQFGKILDQFKLSAIQRIKLSPFYTERIALGLTDGIFIGTLTTIAMETYQNFCEAAMPLSEALEFEIALESVDKLLQYVADKGERVFDKVAQEAKSLRASQENEQAKDIKRHLIKSRKRTSQETKELILGTIVLTVICIIFATLLIR